MYRLREPDRKRFSFLEKEGFYHQHFGDKNRE